MDPDRDALPAWIDFVLADAKADRAAHATLPMIRFPRAVRLPPTPPGWIDAGYAVTFDRRLAILRTRAAERGAAAEEPATPATLSLFDGADESERRAFALTQQRPLFDRLADGSWLVIDTIACADRPNAMRIAPDGSQTSLRLGNGAEQLQADPDGGFWIGYRDDGIYGGVHGVEHGGVVRFDAAGGVTWSLNGDNTASPDCAPHCDHSYALSIAASGRWAYTYSDFLLTRLDWAGQGPRVLRPKGLTFADAIAADGDALMLIGMGHRPAERLGFDRIARLGPPRGTTRHRASVEWIARVHRAINPRERLWTARSDTLHCVRGRTWHRLSIAEADAQMRKAGTP